MWSRKYDNFMHSKQKICAEISEIGKEVKPVNTVYHEALN